MFEGVRMYGLIMLREYLDEILDKKKSFDARSYPTNIRGDIALVDTRKSEIVGLVNLVGIHKISAEEYLSWHMSSKYENIVFKLEDTNSTYYAYDFINPRRLLTPIKVKKTGKVWTSIDENLLLMVQGKLL